jgi:hypothetical protein
MPNTFPRPSSVTVNDSGFVFAHGRKPRGRGGWAFAFERSADCTTVTWFNGTFTKAAKQARVWAAAQGRDTVFVQS